MIRLWDKLSCLGLTCTVCAYAPPQAEGKPCKLCGVTYTAARASAVQHALTAMQAPTC